MLLPRLLLIVNLLIIISSKEPNRDLIPFNATSLHKLNRISGYVLTPNNQYAVFVNRKWDEVSGKFTSNLKYISVNSQTGEAIDLTTPSLEYQDINPAFSANFPNLIFFLRIKEGRVHIYYMDFLPATFSASEPVQFTNYPLDVSNMIITGNTIVFSTEMFYDCEDMTCTANKFEEIAKRGPNTYSLYTELMIRHWDTWYTEGAASHVFYQKMENDGNIPKLHGEPVDMILSQKLCSPPIEYGSEQFAISSDENLIAFSTHKKDRNMSWTTKWDILIYEVSTKQLINVTSEDVGRAQNPKFSSDNSKLAYFYMKRAGLESDILRLKIYDINNKKFIPAKTVEEPLPFPQDFVWSDSTNNVFILTTIDAGHVKLYKYSHNEESAYTLLTDDKNAYGTPNLLTQDTFFVDYTSYQHPTVLGFLVKDTTTGLYETKILCDPNKDFMLNFEMVEPDSFLFKGAKGDTIQGWIMKPINFDENKKYPLAFLIHGGPEGSWDPAWSYRWNPQLWANHNYAVVMINPHGSSGMGIDFQDAVRNDWGGAPFEDLMLGWEYVKNTYQWIDMDRVGGCGASYGGYMINWIQGHNDDQKFKCLVTHDGVFSTVTMFYATEEMWFPMSEYCTHDNWGCTPFNSDEERKGYEQFSPESRVSHWKTPHLIIHGSKDYRIPITEGISAFTALQIRNIPSRFVHFPEENHWVLKPENSIKWYEEVLGWLDKFLNNN